MLCTRRDRSDPESLSGLFYLMRRDRVTSPRQMEQLILVRGRSAESQIEYAQYITSKIPYIIAQRTTYIEHLLLT